MTQPDISQELMLTITHQAIQLRQAAGTIAQQQGALQDVCAQLDAAKKEVQLLRQTMDAHEAIVDQASPIGGTTPD